MDAVTTIPTSMTLAEHAAVIRALGKRLARDIVEIGHRLTLCKAECGHGGWSSWLDHEFGWQESTALRFMQVATLAKNSKLPDLSIPISGLYLLARPSTLEEAQEAVIDKAKAGGKVSLVEIKRMISDARKKQQEEGEAYFERKIASVQKKHDAEVEKLRDELSSVLTPAQAKKAIKEAVKPLLDRIEKYKKSIEKLRQKKPPTEGDKIQEKFGTAPVAIDLALTGLVEKLTITPEQVIEHQQMISKATGQSAAEGLSQKISNARRAIAWLEKFLALTSEQQQ